MADNTDTQEFERIKETLTGARVLFPEKPDRQDDVGIITNVYLQPAIDLDNKPQKGIVFVSKDELPDERGNYPNTKLRPKILCRVQFKNYVHMTEPEDLILIGEENSDQ